MIKLKISKKYNNKKLVNVLLDSFPALSNSVIYKTLRKKDILINGVRIKENITVFENDDIIAYIPDEFLTFTTNLNIVYEDENILVINKPTGIAITKNAYLEQTLTRLSSKYLSRGYAMPSFR